MNWIYDKQKNIYIFKGGGTSKLVLDPNAKDYILLLENRHKKGYKNGRWYKYDNNTGGAGIDIRYNQDANSIFRTQGYLTDEQEMNIRQKNLNYGLGVIQRKHNYIVDPEQQLITLGLIYRGDASKIRSLYNEDTNIYRENVAKYYDSIGHKDRAEQIRSYRYPKTVPTKQSPKQTTEVQKPQKENYGISNALSLFGQSPWAVK